MNTGLTSFECTRAEGLHETVLDDTGCDSHLRDEWPWVLLTLKDALPAEAGPSRPMTRNGYACFQNMDAPNPAPLGGNLQPLTVQLA